MVVAPDQRAQWEPRLSPYREAVVVAAADACRARDLLAGLPGTTLVLAGPGPDGAPAGLPGSADDRLPLDGFLAALARRAGRLPKSWTRSRGCGSSGNSPAR